MLLKEQQQVLKSCATLERKKLNQNLKSLKELLTTVKFEFKVICLTETWCTDDPRN